MHDLNWYLDTAKNRAGIASDAKLAQALGIAQPGVPKMRKGRHLPGARTMQRLAELARVPEEQAAADLALWHAERDPDARWMVENLERLFQRVSGTAAALALLFVLTNPGTADAATNGERISANSRMVYIMENNVAPGGGRQGRFSPAGGGSAAG